MHTDNRNALLAVILAAALAIFSPRGTLAHWLDSDAASPASARAAPAVVASAGRWSSASECTSQIRALTMQYGGDAMPVGEIEAACAAARPPVAAEATPLGQD